MSWGGERSRRRVVQVVGSGFVVGLYYASQWVTEHVHLRTLLPFGADSTAASWVTAIDHHLVQLGFALACIWYLSRGDWRSWGLNARNPRETRRLLTRGFLPVLLVVLFLGEFLVPVLSGTPPQFEDDLTPVTALGLLVFMGVVSGLSEEILFRGLVQTSLSSLFDRVFVVVGHELTLAGLLTAVVFTVAHVGFTLSPPGLYHLEVPQLVLAFVMGLYYAIVYHETESLVGPIVAHNAVNGTIMVATLLAAWVLA